jgi:hypothetical protein
VRPLPENLPGDIVMLSHGAADGNDENIAGF